MLLHLIKLVPNYKMLTPLQVEAVATLRNEAFGWDSSGSDLLMALSSAQKHSFW